MYKCKDELVFKNIQNFTCCKSCLHNNEANHFFF